LDDGALCPFGIKREAVRLIRAKHVPLAGRAWRAPRPPVPVWPAEIPSLNLGGAFDRAPCQSCEDTSADSVCSSADSVSWARLSAFPCRSSGAADPIPVLSSVPKLRDGDISMRSPGPFRAALVLVWISSRGAALGTLGEAMPALAADAQGSIGKQPRLSISTIASPSSSCLRTASGQSF
jgi:hypothetical protein